MSFNSPFRPLLRQLRLYQKDQADPEKGNKLSIKHCNFVWTEVYCILHKIDYTI